MENALRLNEDMKFGIVLPFYPQGQLKDTCKIYKGCKKEVDLLN